MRDQITRGPGLLRGGAAALIAAASLAALPQSTAAMAGNHGVKPINGGHAAVTRGTQLTLHSSKATGVITPSPTVYLVFWGSQWATQDPQLAAPALVNFFTGLYGSADNWGPILSQYCEGLPKGTVTCGSRGTHVQHPTSTPLAGTWNDSAAPEPSSATAAQLAAEATRAAQHFGNTTAASNLNAQYVIASASGTHPDGFPSTGFCGWHNFVTSSAGRVAYTNLPYVPDLGTGGCTTLAPAQPLDGYFSTETHEYAESVTDIFPSNGWLTSRGGSEIGDLCINLDRRITLSTGSFDVQGLWSNAARACVTAG